MSVLIKSMDIPKSCSDCPLNYDEISCAVTGTRWWSDTMILLNFDYTKERLNDCPLLEVQSIQPEPCEDAVSRKDVQSIAERSDWFESSDSFNDFMWALYALPSVTPKRKWIPCSERLPEVGTYVLISKKALNFRSNLPSVCTAHRSCDPRSGKEEWNDMLFGELDDDDVLAWMPLPEPYREEGEQDG